MKIAHMDVMTAYLNILIDTDVFIERPKLLEKMLENLLQVGDRHLTTPEGQRHVFDSLSRRLHLQIKTFYLWTKTVGKPVAL